MKKYIEQDIAIEQVGDLVATMSVCTSTDECFGMKSMKNRALDTLRNIPVADVVEEENILKFYYVRSIDEYWIGQRIDNFYYAEYDPKSRQWVWTHSRYLPWGEHIVSPTSLWKEHTYPSEPEEIPFAEWLQGFIKKHAADAVEVKHGRWIYNNMGGWKCSECNNQAPFWCMASTQNLSDYCPNCGAKMDLDGVVK